MSDSKQNREQQLFEAAVQKLDLQERRAFLDEACRDDPALRARMELLLEGHFQAEGFLTKPPHHAPLPSEPAPAESPSTMIGRYKLLEKIGEGGFGDVWMAEQQEPVKRRVAVKILKLGMDTRQVVRRFEAERQALALMDHPNIARVLDGGATESGRPYFVMDLVRGIRITDYCDQNQLTTRERLDLFIPVCQAIQHAHQKGIIHRDIKPSNILVTLHDGVPVPKVIDFGIAKATQRELTDKTLFTQFQQFIGTPTYVSPEQAEMSGLDIDTRSDIYSLGVLLYELLVGRTPFDEQELLRGGLEALRKLFREREPQRPSTKLNTLSEEDRTTTARRRQTDAPRLAHLLRGDLDWIVMKCLEKDRTRRYETASGLAADIQHHLGNEPVTAGPPRKLYRAGKFIRRHRVGVAFAVSLVTVLVAGLVLALVGFAEARRERDAKELEAARAKSVSDLLLAMLDSANPEATKGTDYTVRELLDEFSEHLEDQLKNQPEVAMSVHATIGKAYRRLGETNKSKLHLDAAVKTARRYFGPDDPRYAELLVDRAHPSLPAAEEHLREALNICRNHPGNPELMIRAFAALQRCVRTRGGLQETEAVTLEALAYAAQFPDREFADIGTILHTLAAVQGNQDPAQAEATARRALAIHRRTRGSGHPEIAFCLRNLGIILSRQNKLSEAEDALREALTVFRRNFRPGDPLVTRGANELASVLLKQGELKEAEALYLGNLELLRKSLGPEHPSVAAAYAALQKLLLDNKKFEEAEKLTRDWVGSLRAVSSEAAKDALAKALVQLSEMSLRSGRLREVVALRRESLDLQRNSLGIEHPKVVAARDSLCQLLLDHGQAEKAEELLRESAGWLRSVDSETSVTSLAGILLQLSQHLYSQGKLAEARQELLSAISLFERIVPNQIDGYDLYRCVLLSLGLGDTNAYQTAIQRIIVQAATAPSVTNSHLMYWACVLKPTALTNYAPVFEAVSTAIARETNGLDSLFDLQTRGALHHRARRYGEAREQLVQVHQFGQRFNPDATRTSPAYSAYFLAMTNARLGRTNEAGDWYHRALILDPTIEETSGSSAAGITWNRRLTFTLLRQEAETVLREELGMTSSPLDSRAAKEARARVAELLDRGVVACTNHNWTEAVGAFDASSKTPAFDWALARETLPSPEIWIAFAITRTGDYKGHLEFCQEYGRTPGWPRSRMGDSLEALLLPTNPAPELLTLASNSLPASEPVFTYQFELDWFLFHRSLFEYRSGRYSEALASAGRVTKGHRKFAPAFKLIIQSMASHRLGQASEARKLWQQAKASIPELQLEPKAIYNVYNLLLFDYFLEEAAGLLGLENELPEKPAAEAQTTNVVVPPP